MIHLFAAVLAAAPAPPFVRVEPPGQIAGAMAPGFCRTASELCLTWIDHPADAYRLRFARLQKGVWTAPVTIAESPRLVVDPVDTPAVERGGDGALIAHWAERNGAEHHAQDIVLARSTDDGKTWRRLGLANDDGTPTEHGHTSLVPETKGMLALWLDGRQTVDGGPTSLRAGGVGVKSVVSEVVDPRVCDCCNTSGAMTAQGPVIAYRDRSGDETRDISIVRRVDGRWTEPRTVRADGWSIAGCPMNGPAVAARGRAVAVAWYTYGKSRPRVRVAFSKDSGATFGEAIDVDAARGTSAPIGRVGLLLDDDGSALVSWMATRREAVEVLIRRVFVNAKLGEALLAGTSGSARQSGFARIARDEGDVIAVWPDASGLTIVRAPMKKFPTTDSAPAEAGEVARPPALAPDTEVATLDGKKVSLTSLKGRPVLVNFWATWCEPCRVELPELVSLDARYRDQGLVVVGVSVDGAAAAEIRAFAERRKVRFQLWHDPQERLGSAFGVQTLPASFLIDRSGKVVWSATGAIAPGDPGLAAAIGAVLSPTVRP